MRNWIIDVLIKKGGPSAIRAALVALTGLLIAHAGVLGHLGVLYDHVSNVITINLNTLSSWLDVTGLTALGGMIIKILNYHTASVLKPIPPSL